MILPGLIIAALTLLVAWDVLSDDATPAPAPA
jgi:hypothetical protein